MGDEIPSISRATRTASAPGWTDASTDDDSDDESPSVGADGSVLEFADVETATETSDDDEDDDEDDEDEETVEPVELLVQLAKDGDIDPWDIDIVAVTDKFLEAIDEVDLRTSGRALFYARPSCGMKSDELFATDEPDEEELPPWEAPFADDGPMDPEGDDGREYPPGFDPVENLEEEMERPRAQARPREAGDAGRTGPRASDRRARHLVEGITKLRHERFAEGVRPRRAGAELPLGR